MPQPGYFAYLGSALPSGKTLAKGAVGYQQPAAGRRLRLLSAALDSGALKPTQLGAYDQRILAAYGKQLDRVEREQGDGGGKSLGGFISNFLGEKGVYGMLKGLPMGLYTLGKSSIKDTINFVGDVAQGRTPRSIPTPVGLNIPIGGKSETYKNVLKPIGESYAYMYGGKGAPKGSSFWDRFYEAPAGPIMDVASVVSGGATLAGRGGGMIARVGRLAEAGGGNRALRAIGTGVNAMPALRDVAERASHITSAKYTSPFKGPTLANTRQPLELRGIGPVKDNIDLGVPVIERSYSRSPTFKLLQILGDELLEGPLKNTRARTIAERYATNQWLRGRHGEHEFTGQAKAQELVRGARRVLEPLSPPEMEALIMLKMGVTPKTLPTFVKQLRESVEGVAPAGKRAEDFPEVDPAVTLRLLELRTSPEVKQFVRKPSDAMIRASQFMEEADKRLLPLLRLDPKQIESARYGVQKWLRSPQGIANATQRQIAQAYDEISAGLRDTAGEMERAIGEEFVDVGRFQELVPRKLGTQVLNRIAGKQYSIEQLQALEAAQVRKGRRPIATGYFPAREPMGMRVHEPNALQRLLGQEPEIQAVKRRERSIRGPNVTAENAMRPPSEAFLQPRDVEMFLSGQYRSDPRVFYEYLAAAEEWVERVRMSDDFIQRFSPKVNGETLFFKDTRQLREWEAKNGFSRGEFTLVPEAALYTFFKKDLNVAKEMLKILEREKGKLGMKPLDTEVLTKFLNDALDDNAQQFSLEFVSAMKANMVPVRTQALEYYLHQLNQTAPFNTAIGRFVSNISSTWKNLVLVYMPRWWVNTALGSAFLALVRGVVNPRDYTRALRLLSRGDLPAGVRMGFHGMEQLHGPETATPLRITRMLYKGPQLVEDYFRTAAFAQRVRSSVKQTLAEEGKILGNYERLKNGMSDKQFWDEIFRKDEAGFPVHQRLLDYSIQETNHFAYNYNLLGPFERRYIRQFVPFWGWYRFITKLVWTMPMRAPIRSNIILKLGQLGHDYMNDIAGGYPLPPWMKGVVMLNTDRKALEYLTTFGVNPFSQYFNPTTGEGLMSLAQFSPAIQIGLNAIGIDTYKQGPVSASPFSDVQAVPGIPGQYVNVKTGEESTPGETNWLARLVGGTMRAFPQVRILESNLAAGGRSVYPESIPFFNTMPMLSASDDRVRDTSLSGILKQFTGIYPRIENLDEYQRKLQRKLKATRTSTQRARKNYLQRAAEQGVTVAP